MAFTNTWNANFEATPPDTGENISQGANRIRALKNALRERLEVDHYWDEAGTDADHGEHTKIKFHGNQATPANVANKSTLYPQTANGKLELWYKNDANQAVQLTANGAVNFTSPIPANTVMLFYADTAPTGWTIKNTAEWNDITVMLTKGSAAGGESGGANNANGTWTQPDHTLTVGEIPSHTHTYTDGTAPYYGQPAGGVPYGTYTANTGATGGGNAHNHGTTWRPASKNFIACEKD